MIYIHNIFAAPLLLLAWAIDLYLTMAGLRLVLSQLRGEWAVRLSRNLAELTDGIPNSLTRCLSRGHLVVRAWVPWTIVIAVGLIVRHALLRLILAIA